MLLQRQMLMHMLPAVMVMTMNMDQVIRLKECPVIQDRFSRASPDNSSVPAKHIHRIGYLPDKMQVMRRGNNSLALPVRIDHKINNVPNG